MSAQRNGRPPARGHLRFWLVAGFLVAVAAFLLWSQPLLFRSVGVKRNLLAKAARLRGLPAERAVPAVGRMLREVLSVAGKASLVEARLAGAGPDRLALTLSLPWRESSGKVHRRRAETAARLAAALLAAAGAERTAVLVEVRRRRKRPSEGPASLEGRYRIEPGGRAGWTPARR